MEDIFTLEWSTHKLNEIIIDENKNNITDNYNNMGDVENALNDLFQRLKIMNKEQIHGNEINILKVLNRLSFNYFCKVVNLIDQSLPGMIFHFVMLPEHGTTKKYLTNPHNSIEITYFLKRIDKITKKGLLAIVLAPMRARLVAGVLEKERENIIENKLQYIQNELVNFEIWLDKDYSYKNEGPSCEHELRSKLDMLIQNLKEQTIYKNLTVNIPYLSDKEFIKIIQEVFI